MKSLKFIATFLAAAISCHAALAEATKWSIEASFYENATWRKIWILKISSSGEASLSFTNDPFKNSKRTEANRKISEQEISTIQGLKTRLKNGEIEDVYPETTLMDGPVFFIEVKEDGKMTEMVSMHIGSSEPSSERSKFIEAWKALAEIFPSNAPIPEKYEYNN